MSTSPKALLASAKAHTNPSARPRTECRVKNKEERLLDPEPNPSATGYDHRSRPLNDLSRGRGPDVLVFPFVASDGVRVNDTATSEPGRESETRRGGGWGRVVGLGLITGAADDDPSAIGTYASAGARFGLDILWTAPVLLPMMYSVVYLSSKLAQVSGRGLFETIRHFYPR